MRWFWWDLQSVFGVGMGGISPFSIWKSSFFNAIIMWLFCIDVVVWCFCFLFIVAFAHVYTCLFITCPCLSVCILCSYATCVWPEFIFNKVMFCSGNTLSSHQRDWVIHARGLRSHSNNAPHPSRTLGWGVIIFISTFGSLTCMTLASLK